jgi:uncharacterized protein with ParB-like and HNH nuclease domain
MNVLNPSGRLSKVEKKGQVFQIQTEFYHRPRPKITSTVILNGKIMNKIDTPWEEKLITDEDLKKTEKALREQHQKVAQMIEVQKVKAQELEPQKPHLIKSHKKISEVEGVEDLVIADMQGEILYANTDSVEVKALLKVLSSVNKLGKSLSQSTRLGDFLGGQIKLERKRTTWIYQKDKLWMTSSDQKMDFYSFLEKVKRMGVNKKVE